jgi:hypothetical protein
VLWPLSPIRPRTRVRSWQLYEYPELGETAYPLLLKHLRLVYPGPILNGIARAFTKDVARGHWQELLNIYLIDGRPEVRDGLGATLSGCAVRTHYADLVAIVGNRALGESRILRPTAGEPHWQPHGRGRRTEGHRAFRN